MKISSRRTDRIERRLEDSVKEETSEDREEAVEAVEAVAVVEVVVQET